MPEICRFYGISIKLFFRDHPPPHFHVEYGEYRAMYDIETLALIEGIMPRTADKLVTEWAEIHRESLREIWETQVFEKLPPLE